MPPFRISCSLPLRSLASNLALLFLVILPAGCGGLIEYRYCLDNSQKAEILQSFPHDSSAFTQGLAWDEGILIESTGLKGVSSLRKVHLNTGEVMQHVAHPADIFAEGATVFHDKIYQLTWKNNRIYVYDKNDLSLLNSHHYPKEGWGITHDGTQLITSDGSEYLYFHAPVTLKETHRISVHCVSGNVKNLNELEYVEGMIFANIWKQDLIAVIDPRTGLVEKWLDLSVLRNNLPGKGEDIVFNGIAYDPIKKRLFVTGKNSPLVFEINIPVKHDKRERST